MFVFLSYDFLIITEGKQSSLFLLYLEYSSGGRKSSLLRHKSQSIILLEAFKLL